jgi:hypothetical protein
MIGYIALVGEPGCLPDHFEFAATRAEADTMPEAFCDHEVSIISVDEFLKNNGLDPATATDRDLARLLS